MSIQMYPLDQFQPPQSTVLDSYSTSDSKLSTIALNDLFSEFDTNANTFQYLDSSTNEINYPQSIPDLSLSYNNSLPAMTTNHNRHDPQAVSDELLSPNAYRSLIELYQRQPSSSSPNHIALDDHESWSTNMSYYQTTNGSRSSALPVQLPPVIQRAEPIAVTFDQFQALMRSTNDTTTTSSSHPVSTFLQNSTIIGYNIPLKIVSQTNSNSSDESNQPDLMANNNDRSTTRNDSHNPTRRNSTHNAIEKRYRSSINEKIHELKDIIAVRDTKIQKSAILRRTIEYIRQLQSTNERLEEENSTLKIILKQFNLTHDDFSNHNHARSTKRNSAMQHSSYLLHDDHSKEEKHKRRRSKRGMGDGSRLVLCCFMFCVLLTNPFNYLLDRFHPSVNVNIDELETRFSSRTLQSTSVEENWNISSKQLIGWMLNIAICLVCMVKLFVYGEAIVHECEMQEYYIDKKEADQLMNENRLHQASLSYEKCCAKLYVTVDQTYLYYFTSITWQISRLCLNIIYLGRWLTCWAGWTKSIDTRDYNLELNDCFFRLWKIEYQQSESFLKILNLFLLTINTSIATGRKLDGNKRNEICLLSALTLRKCNGLFIPCLLKFLKPIQLKDQWLLEIDCLHEFLLRNNVDLLTHQSLMESIRTQYFQYILLENIKHQLLYQDEQDIKFPIKNDNELDQYSWWHHSLQVIRCISSNRHLITSNLTIYHLTRIEQLVDDRYTMIIETIHKILLILTDEDDPKDSTRIRLLEQLGRTSRVLITMMEINHEDNLELAIRTVLLDGILSLRLRLLTNSLSDSQRKIPFLDDFQQELEYYKQLNHAMKLPKQRYYLFESVFRASSGLNPSITEALFERAIKQSNSMLSKTEGSSTNLDIIAALLFFCHFSPSIVYRYRNILQQAVFTSRQANQNHDLNRLQQRCLTLIRQPYLTL